MVSHTTNIKTFPLEVNDKKFSKKKYLKPYLMRRSKNRPDPTLLRQRLEDWLTNIKELRVQLAVKRSALSQLVQERKTLTDIKPKPERNIISVYAIPNAVQAIRKETTTKTLPVKAANSKILKLKMKKNASNVKIYPVSFIPKTAELVRYKIPDVRSQVVIPLTNKTATTKDERKPNNIEIRSSKPSTSKKENQTEILDDKLGTCKKNGKQEIIDKHNISKKKDQLKINNAKLVFAIKKEVATSKKEINGKLKNADLKNATDHFGTSKKDQQEINNAKLDFTINRSLGDILKEKIDACTKKAEKEINDKPDTNRKADQKEAKDNLVTSKKNQQEIKNAKLDFAINRILEDILKEKIDASKKKAEKEINDKLGTNRKSDQEEAKDNLGRSKKDQQEIKNAKLGFTINRSLGDILTEKIDASKKKAEKEIHDKLDTNRKPDQKEVKDNIGTSKKDQQEIKNAEFCPTEIVDQVVVNNKELDTSKKEDQPEINNNKLGTSTTKDDPDAAVVRVENRKRIRLGRGKRSIKLHKSCTH